MADILAVASERTDRPVGRRGSGKWSRQLCTLTIIGLSLLGWAILGSVWQQLPIF
jgi:hypothetical protein